MLVRCFACDILAGTEKANVVYEDEMTLAFMAHRPLAPGHIIIIPKQHHEKIEDVPSDMIAHYFSVASAAGAALFEGVSATGTNIIANEGHSSNAVFPHFAIHVIPRKDDDGLKLNWKPQKPAEQGKLESTQKKIKEETFMIGKRKREAAPEPVNLDEIKREFIPSKISKRSGNISRGDREAEKEFDNHMIKQLKRSS